MTDLRCPACSALLARVVTAGSGSIEVKCKCRRLVRIQHGQAAIVDDTSRGQSPMRPEPFATGVKGYASADAV